MSENLSPTGSGAPIWYVNCGSFLHYGNFGDVTDHMMETYLACGARGTAPPDRVRMGRDVYRYWLQSRQREAYALCVRLRGLLSGAAPAVHDLSVEIIGALKALNEKFEERDQRYYAASVVCDETLPPDTMWFSRDGEIVGECAGWIA